MAGIDANATLQLGNRCVTDVSLKRILRRLETLTVRTNSAGLSTTPSDIGRKRITLASASGRSVLLIVRDQLNAWWGSNSTIWTDRLTVRNWPTPVRRRAAQVVIHEDDQPFKQRRPQIDAAWASSENPQMAGFPDSRRALQDQVGDVFGKKCGRHICWHIFDELRWNERER